MQAQLPIDIHSNKLLDWLVSRRHVGRNWQSQVLIIRSKINNAIQDMPEHDGITKLLAGTYINYFHCKKIIEILKETEADTKNFFGSYGSKRMKDWQEIVKLYEKDGVYLAEAAQLLVRNVNYEVPAIKKQITKCEQFQVECEKKVAECTKTSNALRGEFQTSCKQIGIQSQNIKRELVERLQELPGIYKKVAEDAKSLESTVEFFTEFVKFLMGQEYPDGCVPMLKYVIKNGNTTTYQWVHGEQPLSVEEPPLNIQFDGEDVNNDGEAEIDFGDFVTLDATGEISDGMISLDATGEVSLDTSDTIEWIDDSLTKSPEEIDFNISLDNIEIEVVSSGLEGGVARGDEALTLLDNPTTRTMFLNDLKEVESFLKVRLSEMRSSSGDLLSMSLMQDAPVTVQVQSVENVEAMLKSVKKIVTHMLDQGTQHLHSIKHSPKYVDHLANSLKQKLSAAEKMAANAEAAQKRGLESREEAQTLRPKLKLIIQKTKELQSQIQDDLSKKYNNRPVNLMGGIKTL